MRRLVHVIAAAALAACSPKDEQLPPTPPGPVLGSIAVTPATPAVFVGQSVALRATGTYDDGSEADVTSRATWSTSDGGLVSISNEPGAEGTARGVAAGTATITAALDGVQGSTDVQVVPVEQFPVATIRIDPAMVTVSPSATAPVVAYARSAAGAELDVTSLATWSTDSSTIATVAAGLVSGASAGTTQIHATWSGKTGSATVVVESAHPVALRLSTPPSMSLGVGVAGRPHAFALYSDLSLRDVTELATWASSDSTVLSISDDVASKAWMLAASPGSATITATWAGLSASTSITVLPRAVLWLVMTPTESPLPVGAVQQLRVGAMYADHTVEEVTASAAWTSSSAAVSVSGAGVATANEVGAALVTASYGGMEVSVPITVVGSAPTSLTVTPFTAALHVGEITAVAVELSYPDGSAWDVSETAALASSSPAVADVEMSSRYERYVRAKGVGSATLQASHAGLTGTAELTVGAITRVEIVAPPELPLGASVWADAIGWWPTGPSSSSGRFVGSLAEWSSSAPSVVEVSNAPGTKGKLTAKAQGTATLTVQFAGFEATANVAVRARAIDIRVDPLHAEIEQGATLHMTAIATLEDRSTLDVTEIASWSSDGAVAWMAHGAVMSGGPGTTLVTASFGGAAGRATLTVLPRPADYVSIEPASPSTIRLPPGVTTTLAARAVYLGGWSVRYPREGVTWTSSDPAVVSFSAVPGREGEMTANAVGTATITAAYGGAMSIPPRTVVVANLASVAPPAPITMPAAGSQQLVLTGTFDGSVTSNLSPFLAWTTTDADVAIVRGGIVLAMAPGTATLQTSAGTLPASVSVTVTNPSISGLRVDTVPEMAVGSHAAASVRAQLSNGDDAIVTHLVTLSDSTGKLSITGSTFEAVAVGTGQVWTSWGGRTAWAMVEVDGVVPYLTVEPVTARAIAGGVVCPVVQENTPYPYDVSALAEYASSNPGVASLDGSCVTAQAPGTALVTGTYGGQIASMALLVEPVIGGIEVSRLGTSRDEPLHVLERAGYGARTLSGAEATRGTAWQTGDAGVARVVQPGVVEAVASGATTLAASAGGMTSAARWVRVLPVALADAETSRWAVALPRGARYPLQVSATYADGVTGIDVTGAATWWTETPSVASFDPAVPNVLVGNAVGVTHVEARLPGKTVRIPVTVF